MGKTSSEVKNRWNRKTYKQYTISLRHDTDEDIIELLDEAKEDIGVTELVRRAIREYCR